jgi:hypothetical protein
MSGALHTPVGEVFDRAGAWELFGLVGSADKRLHLSDPLLRDAKRARDPRVRVAACIVRIGSYAGAQS